MWLQLEIQNNYLQSQNLAFTENCHEIERVSVSAFFFPIVGANPFWPACLEHSYLQWQAVPLGFTSRQLKTATCSLSETKEQNQIENPKTKKPLPKQEQKPSQAIAHRGFRFTGMGTATAKPEYGRYWYHLVIHFSLTCAEGSWALPGNERVYGVHVSSVWLCVLTMDYRSGDEGEKRAEVRLDSVSHLCCYDTSKPGCPWRPFSVGLPGKIWAAPKEKVWSKIHCRESQHLLSPTFSLSWLVELSWKEGRFGDHSLVAK